MAWCVHINLEENKSLQVKYCYLDSNKNIFSSIPPPNIKFHDAGKHSEPNNFSLKYAYAFSTGGFSNDDCRGRTWDSPYWLCQGFGGVLRHKHVTGKPVVCRVLGDKTKIPAEGKERGRSAHLMNGCFRCHWTLVDSDRSDARSVNISLDARIGRQGGSVTVKALESL